MEEWVQHIDCTQCIVRVSNKLGFSCPIIEDVNEESGSGFTIQNIRHPLVEATASRVSYVTHDVSLGMNGIKGWLVYGMNASGKSTLMKATGIAILLAQAGCFVPATEMILRPFKSIYTRILNQDNLFSGLSSFAVEMSELRDILVNANQNTLVLGDELCSGTESTSAQALVSAGIQYLCEKNAKFIFATHLHDIPNVIDVKLLCVEVWHLHVDYDPISKVLKYDRSLRKGSGSSLYGLEVARAMDLPFAFIEQALKNRHVIDGSTDVTKAKNSTWNASIIRKECENCGLQITKELEVHHIKERNSALKGILENGTHMNNMRNLMVVCQKCHDEIHNNCIEIGSVIQTSEGSVRTDDISSLSSESKRNKKTKWSEEDLQTIYSVIEKFKKSSLKAIRAYLESKHEITVSEGVLSKMRKGEY
jgi:DNA mismatch repair protein MutS